MKKRFIFLSLSLVFFVQVILGQSILLKGDVVDNEGTPLPGVNVSIKGSNKGVITSIEGKYVINNVLPTDSVAFSYIGYKPQIYYVGNKTTINVILEETVSALDEYTVVAFQKQKKESVIGSISTLAVKDLKVPQSNLTTALAGKMAGIISYQRSGEPGKDNADFFVRGVTTFGYKSSPLILIDGLEVTTDDLARLEPDNVASFSIMKDATATALYGARGANGVILVTTKVGKKGKMTVSARIETSISTPTKINKFLNGVDYMETYNKALRTREPNALLFYSKDKIEGTRQNLDSEIYPNVDWYGDLFNNSVQNYKANVNASGGGDVAQYYLSVAYTNEKGLLKVDNLNNFNNNIDIKRYNIRANVDFNFTKTTKAAIKVYSLLDRSNSPIAEATDIFYSVMQANPVNFPKYFSKDATNQYIKHTMFGNKGNGGYTNPYAEMVKGYKDRFTSTSQSQFQIEQDLSMITKGLKARGLASINVYGFNESARSFSPFYYGMKEVETETGIDHSLYIIKEGTESLNDPAISNYTNSSFYFEAVLQYDRTFSEKHEVGALIVGTARESLNTIIGGALATLPSRNMGVSGRLTYGFDGKYFLEANFGYNGSEKFEKKNRFGFFPSAGLGWNITNESFFPENLKKTINTFKLRATYGLVGNDAISDPADRFFYLSDVNINDGTKGYATGSTYSNWYNGYSINRYSNPLVTWEVAQKANYGLELSLFDKLNIQVDYFSENRSNIYMQREYTPTTMGLSSLVSSNIGKARTKGIDASADLNWVINKNFWLSSRVNFTYSTNELTENGEPIYQYPYLSRIGQPIDQQWGFVAERLFVDEEDVLNSPAQFGNSTINSQYMPGDVKYVDINNDGEIDDDDRVPIGYPTVPEIIYGFGASTGWKDIDFSFFFQGSARSSFFIDPTKISPFVNERNALQDIINSYWSDDNPNPNAFWPRLSIYDISNNNKQSTWWLRDGSFLRLKSVELGYTFPTKVVKKLGVYSIRTYFSGTNLFVISKFKLWDPEMGGNGLGYPTQRIFNIGMQLSF